jgi:hypothetical protein
VEWDLWALLAVVSAAGLGAVNFVVAYQAAADWKTFRNKLRVVRGNLLLLLGLEACAGFAATWIVVGLGLTQPDWLDDPLGWVVLGLVGPALAGASIATIKVSGTDVNLGLSLVYTPLRDHLLKRIGMQSKGVDISARQRYEVAFRQRAHDRYDGGETDLHQRLLDALREYAEGKDVSDEERQQLEFLETQVGQPGTPPKEQLSLMVPVAVRLWWIPILEGVLGVPSDEELARLDPAAPPGTAAVLPTEPESRGGA